MSDPEFALRQALFDAPWPLRVTMPITISIPLPSPIRLRRNYFPRPRGLRFLEYHLEHHLEHFSPISSEELDWYLKKSVSKDNAIRAEKIKCYLQEENDFLRTMLHLELDVKVAGHTSACIQLEIENAALRQIIWADYLYSPGPPGSPGGSGMLVCKADFNTIAGL